MSKLNLLDFSSTKAKIKYNCAKQAIEISRISPGELYPDFNFFSELLKSENNILKWTAIKVIGNLSKVDDEKKIDRILPFIITFLSNKSMITAANTIGALSEIAINRSEFLDEIITSLLQVEKTSYYNKGEISPECRNVAIGHVIKAFQNLDKKIYYRKDVYEFLKRQTLNTRPKVKKLAEKLLSKFT
jgi:hypothetical protein